jgi:predicted permease
MTGLLQDLRYALRQLRKTPGFTVAVVLTLAIGIGANTAIFSVIDAVLLRPLPYENPKRLVLLQDSQDPENGGFLLKDIVSLRSQTENLADIAFYYRDSGFSNVTIANEGEPQSVQGAFVSSNLFSVMGSSPSVGRVFTSDEANRQERVVILGYGLWTRGFGASQDVIGKELRIDGANFRIIGIMPETFQFPASDQQFWAPVTTNRFWGDPLLEGPDPSHSRYAYERWQAIARPKAGVSVHQAEAEIKTIFSRLSQADPDPNRGSGITATPLHVVLSGNTRRGLTVLFCAVLFVLLIACSNVANLVLARATARAREIALRTALGAGRGRVARQLLTEGVLVALVGGAVGLL